MIVLYNNDCQKKKKKCIYSYRQEENLINVFINLRSYKFSVHMIRAFFYVTLGYLSGYVYSACAYGFF